MAKGILGPDGYIVPTREKVKIGTAEEVNAENNRLVKRLNALQKEYEASAVREVEHLKRIKYLEAMRKTTTKDVVVGKRPVGRPAGAAKRGGSNNL